MNYKSIIKFSVLLFCIIFIASVLFQSCSLKPLSWTPPVKPDLVNELAENDLLKTAEKIDLEGWHGPEDLAMDKEGNLYSGVYKGDFTDGRILKIDAEGNISIFCNTRSIIAGLHFDSDENLIACDMKRGLISIDKTGQISILAKEDENGNKFLIPNAVDIAKDGMIYFSNTSHKYPFGPRNTMKLIFEARPDGGLYSFNPKTKEVKTLIDTTYFANGVAVSKNDDFVLLVDLIKYRIVRHWLKGDNKGNTEIFIENLPGIPNNITRRKDGSFWIACTTRRNDILDKIQPRKGLKKFIYGLPLWLQPKPEQFGLIMHISEDGEVIRTYYDTTGEFVPEASAVEEHNGYLYIGGDVKGHIGKYKLE